MFSRMRSRMPVSYTHLDVYKRQVQEDGDEDATRYGKGFALSGGVTGAVKRVLEERGETADIQAVSYTHLDVYKRQ